MSTRFFVSALALTLLMGIAPELMAQVPSVPAPSGVTLTSNPLDDGISLFKWGIKAICVIVALGALAAAAMLGMPKFLQAANGKGTYSDAAFNMFMLILGAVVVGVLCAFVYTRVGSGGSITAIDPPSELRQFA